MSRHIGAVIVAYYPNLSEFKNVIKSAQAQVDFLVIVDNSNDALRLLPDEYVKSKSDSLEVIANNENLGVATGLNIGIDFLIKKQYTHILFLDQDSLIPKNMVDDLYSEFNTIESKGIKIAAIGPSFYDTSIDKLSPFIRFKQFYGYDLIYADDLNPVVSVHLLITSGTLTSAKILNDIGLKDDGLFIDHVDHEWCLRAISRGYQIFGDSRICMKHSIGNEAITFLNGKHHNHSAIRRYYIARNSVLLLRRSYIPINYRLNILISSFKMFILYTLISKNRFMVIKMMLIGFCHGAINKHGKLQDSKPKNITYTSL
jgi:rhamnosyltransferase